MVHLREGVITKIMKRYKDMLEVFVDIEGIEHKAIAYTDMIGEVSVGDSVLLNTTAVDLNLGTGGYHFIVSDRSVHKVSSNSCGHIMKLRYTPYQIKCLTVEEKYPDIINSFTSLDGMPVAIGSIHSMLPAIAAVIKDMNPCYRIAYIMTDGGALPIAFSNIVRMLKEKNLIDVTITCGNAFGGDLESVNLYTALIGAKLIAKCDACIAIMGPGHVGTGTKLGFTGMEMSNHAHIIHSMGGLPICIPRVSFKDQRERHYGLSHHFLTAMGSYCLVSCHMAFPRFDEYEEKIIMNQYKKFELNKKHKIFFCNENTITIMKKHNLDIKTMGRTIYEDTGFFRTAGACGVLLTKFLS